MKQIIKLGPKQFITTDIYPEHQGNKAVRYISNFMLLTIATGMAFVVTGAMLGTDLSKSFIEWSRPRNTSTILR